MFFKKIISNGYKKENWNSKELEKLTEIEYTKAREFV